MSVIANITTALPAYKHNQSDLGEFMAEIQADSEEKKRKLKMMYAKSGIKNRYSAIPDYSTAKEQRVFFPKTNDLEPFPTLEYRMKFFNREALPLCIRAIEKCVEDKVLHKQITHLITVSCTGLSAPGLDIDIVQSLQLDPAVNRSSVNFMGCYAAIHALKQADYICKCEPNAMVLVVCVELCTIHFQKSDDQDNIVANLLFGDGVAAALVVSDAIASDRKFKGFGIKNFHSQIELNGKRDMSWQLSSTGFLMSLSSYIPELIQRGIKDLFKASMKGFALETGDITHWAIHPGGRKILEVIQKELQLDSSHLAASYRVLKEYGNMSSPTILFVLKDIWENNVQLGKKELTYGVAFGPGLTMESVILENV